jgi:tRNA nucleotidyltransferase (CCA-adding enzyme)
VVAVNHFSFSRGSYNNKRKRLQRIPDVEFGTALDDAERRDFTINSLYYNIHTNQVEDWTGRGWDDLQNGLIVTPLEPRTTFLDDPLRVLRAIRFAVRYDYALTCQSTIQQAEVRSAFATKVSRERVGKELEGMLSGKKARPYHAIKAIHELHLSNLVFLLPPQITTPLTDEEWQQGLDYASRVSEIVQQLQEEDGEEDAGTTTTTISTKADLRLLPLLSYLLPLRNHVYTIKNKERLVIDYIVKESLKFKAKDGQDAVTAYAVLDRMMTLLERQDYSDRITIGLLLRDAKEMWVTVLVLAALLRHDDKSTRYLEAYRCVKGMDQCWNTKPLLDGQFLIKELGIPKGPSVGIAMQAQVEWMLEHPGGTKESCLEYLRQQQRKRHAEEDISK